jgi:hypothetical protein
MKIKREDIEIRNPFWKFSSFKRVHKSKKTYNRKDKHKINTNGDR